MITFYLKTYMSDNKSITTPPSYYINQICKANMASSFHTNAVDDTFENWYNWEFNFINRECGQISHP